MKWFRISDYAITNGRELASPCGTYRHGTHFISKVIVGELEKYTLWEGEKMVGIFESAELAKGAVKL